MFKISKGTDGPVVNVDTAEEIESTVRAAGPGYYLVDELRRGDDGHHTLLPWGTATYHPNGHVAVKKRCFSDEILTQ
jgi:hypothetical protein